jgi:hypothetical protein
MPSNTAGNGESCPLPRDDRLLSGVASQFNYLARLRLMIGFTWLVCQLVILLTGAGLVAGVDGLLKRHLPRWLTGADGATQLPEPDGGILLDPTSSR